ncbi:MAG: hypothetical protein H0T92_25310 [Pyrinomonadaceae bacterium]|nr:hypothetical protein [Pyrinomonadaceae bacterium]
MQRQRQATVVGIDEHTRHLGCHRAESYDPALLYTFYRDELCLIGNKEANGNSTEYEVRGSVLKSELKSELKKDPGRGLVTRHVELRTSYG